MVYVKVHKYSLKHRGINYKAGDIVEMTEKQANDLINKYSGAFSIVENKQSGDTVNLNDELPVVDFATTVKKRNKRK